MAGPYQTNPQMKQPPQGRSDEEFDEDEDSFEPADRIRRSYHPTSRHHYPGPASRQQQVHRQASNHQQQPAQETIQVTLNESYFARERRFLVGQLANGLQKLSSLQLFNPAQNETIKQQQQEWSEKEKYTLDSLNAFNGALGERFQFNKPDDGREVWPSKLQYFLAITSYSIGLGNVIRFPILVQKNGGLAFMIPFVIMLLLEGIPLFYLELAIGQRTRKAAISCWNLVSPFAAGIGLASAAVSFLIGLYYNTMVAWTLLYTWGSLTNKLPPHGFACPAVNDDEAGSTTRYDDYAPAGLQPPNGTDEALECQLAGPFEYFWYRETLDITASVSDWSHFNWPVAFCLLLAWLISYACLVKGLSSSKQLVYVVSTFPYVILLIFFVKALSLPGMGHGLSYFIKPDWPKLYDPYVWLQAAGQVFFSLGLGFGGLIALSSYNQVNNDCYKDAIRVSLINFGTSLLAGVVVFAILGHRASLNHDKCQLKRDQQIDFYLGDYNLKVLEYGAIFKQVSSKEQPPGLAKLKDNVEQFMALDPVRPTGSRPTTTTNSDDDDDDGKQDNKTEQRNDGQQPQGVREAEEQEAKEFGLDDAIDSITSLDRQLDLGSSSGSFDYGDSDTEFVLNASNLIDRRELDKIIENIENLPRCSIQRELDESTRGTGLVFVVLAEAISQFETNSAYWTILFFAMILVLGLDSQFGNLEGLLSSLTDFNFNLNSKQLNEQLPNGLADASSDPHSPTSHHLRGLGEGAAAGGQGLDQQARLQANQIIRQWATSCICLLSLVVSVVMFSHGAGAYMFAIFDEYASSFSLVLIALFELLAISYIYGLKRFCDDCELMTGKRPPFVVLLSWRYISPILLLFLVFATLKQFTVELNYEIWDVFGSTTHQASAPDDSTARLRVATWPNWSIVLGGLLVVACVIWIPLVAILRAMRINLVPDEQQQRWFPAEELKEYHQLQDQEQRQVTKLERILFGFRPDDD